MITDSPSVGDAEKQNLPGNLPLEEVQKRSILEALDAHDGNKSEVARRLGITRKALRKKLDRYEQA